MNTEDIRKIGIIGSGTMGRGIAICSALAGYETIINDISAEALNNSKTALEKILSGSVDKKKITVEEKNGALGRIIFTSDFELLKDCDFIIEAAAEDELIKKEIFSRLDSICRSDAILSTNTSSLSITNISTAVKNNTGRVIGMHFFNPAHIMKLVEIVKGDFTSDETLKTTIELTLKLNKTPVVAKDTPAFIVNRIARPFYGEALKILAEGTSDAETIDKVMKECGKFAMGPFELMDLIGIDVNFSVTKSVYEAFFNDPKYRPSFIQKKMVDANMLGRKTGRGFYNYQK
ncbi:MAG: 3-hydroxybutyryl-CoA dehydrogenase [Ignavibacteria bacterium]|nr:3-hydroxybutyryl-CoA dehydrogenase [Ignavibacteria bacterium]